MRCVISLSPIDTSGHCLRWLRSMRSACLASLALAVFVVFPKFACAQAGKEPPAAEEKTLTTEDNFDLKITYFKSNGGKDASVIVLLHGKRGQRRQWNGVAAQLQKNYDFAVVTVDLRGHGESASKKKAELKKTDYEAMVSMDMKAVKEFVYDEHQKGQLNMNKLGIVACDFSASVAIVYAEVDWGLEPYDDNPVAEQRTPRGQDVQALVLVSPDATTPGLFAGKAATGLRSFPVAVMIASSEKNTHDLSAAKKLFEQVSTKKEKDKDGRMLFKPYPEDVRGTDLVLKDAKLRKDIYDFLVTHVKSHKSEWQDRRSRLDRD